MNFFNLIDCIASVVYRKIWLREFVRKGGTVGKNTVFTDLRKSKIDTTRPWLLEIGDYCVISMGTTILTHDYSLSTIRRVFGVWYGEGRVTRIGDNCFIGMDTVILMGTQIGNNVIVGAGSVVRGIVPDNVVIAGNPARIIHTLEEYKKIREERTKKEAIECAEQFYKRFKREPQPTDLGGFKFLFCPRNRDAVLRYKLSFKCSGDNPFEVEDAFYNSEPYWNSFEDFLNACSFSE